MEALDGNAAAGILSTVFALEPTAAVERVRRVRCLASDRGARRVSRWAWRDDPLSRLRAGADPRRGGRRADRARPERLPNDYVRLEPQARLGQYDRAVLSVDDVRSARETIGGRLHRTPLFTSRTLSQRVGATVRLKAELFQVTGSFKPRGVLNKLASLTPEEKAAGVIAISAGNHAQAVAWAAATEGIDALVVMWQGASEQKIAAAREYGASVDTESSGSPEAFARLAELQAETGRTLVHPFDDPLVQAGQGTVDSRSSRMHRRRRRSSSRSAAAGSSPASRPRRRAGHG